MSRFFVWLLALAAIAIWVPILAGMIARLFWPQVPASIRELTPHDSESTLPTWEPGIHEIGFPQLDDPDDPLDL